MMTFERFAIYYVPPADAAWAQFATAWLGWDMISGRSVAHPKLSGLPMPVADMTQTARRYGLHATLKPPFRMAGGQTRDDLDAALSEFCQGQAPVRLEGLRLTQMGRFLALCPLGDTGLLDRLAARCVEALDRFRAAAPPDELARRRARPLRPAQARNLELWGYPFVMSDFRFHITLTGRIGAADLERIKEILSAALDPLLPAPLVLGELALAGEDADGRFHLLNRCRLSGE